MTGYTVNAGVAAGTTLPIINLTGGASTRINLYEWLLGFSGAPADVATLFKFFRTTDAGTGGTALTVYKVDPLTAAATGTAKNGTFTTGPAVGDELGRLAINQRATHRWVARESRELISAATAANGIELRSESSGGTPTTELTFYWFE